MNDIKSVNAEVLAVLTALGDSYLSKLPIDLIEYLMNNSDKTKTIHIDTNKKIQEQNISKEALAFLSIIKMKYFCDGSKDAFQN